MANERPKLTSLSDRLSRKVQGAEPAAPAEATEPAAEGAKAKGSDGRVQIIVRMTTAERKALRQIALDNDTTAQALAEEAIRDVLRRYGRT
ncbi:ribbon-helix-helix domain-containing protein [Methylobacterium ajmalii]|jgi:hypothetical protein|uniref:ribbon-helix-helix domain-containing protein n=1 Tax=Methylobacterium ajmalii TaxID=2738439 RepID=UPI00190C1925|nr:ribbon-helix-helix domain-containing protein [Methylobacterium ajmalii]MBK3400060.1 hypothetical protein [Methylobacterium ajmalii]MBK3411355.1 hypothetical protein [Methylobacterium ajmalii]MBK3426719.1 hypothetical protein [Methylobacterium ajmalii]